MASGVRGSWYLGANELIYHACICMHGMLDVDRPEMAQDFSGRIDMPRDDYLIPRYCARLPPGVSCPS